MSSMQIPRAVYILVTLIVCPPARLSISALSVTREPARGTCCATTENPFYGNARMAFNTTLPQIAVISPKMSIAWSPSAPSTPMRIICAMFPARFPARSTSSAATEFPGSKPALLASTLVPNAIAAIFHLSRTVRWVKNNSTLLREIVA